VITPPTDLLPIFDFQTATIQIVIASVSEAVHERPRKEEWIASAFAR
jgi:hypothetical protein